MIVQRTTHVKLKHNYKKILYLYEAVNRSFVFLGSKGDKKDCIVHVDKDGKERFIHDFQKPIDSLIMMNDFQAVLLETRANAITILDLHTYQFKRIPHYFMNEQSDQTYLWSFPQTKYLAVVEHGRVNDNRIKLTYFNYPQKNPIESEGKLLKYHKSEILAKEFYRDEGEWTFEYQLAQGNNHSMVIWYKARHDRAFQFRFYRQNKDYQHDESNVDAQNGWEYKEVTVGHNLEELYNFNKLQIAVLDVFELQHNKLFVNTENNRMNPSDEREIVTNTYTVDLETRKAVQSLHNLGKYQQFKVDIKRFGSCHMIRTFEYMKGQIMETPVIYFSNSTCQEIFRESWQCTYRTKYVFPGYDAYVMLQNQYENGGNISEFTCRYKKMIEFKEILLFFMLEMNENFDDDLMQDVVEMICDN